MKIIRKSLVFAALFAGVSVSAARADGIVTVKVPFAFVVDHKEFPAGQYDIRHVEDAGSVIAIEGTNRRLATFAFTIPAEGRDPVGGEPALVFIKRETRYELSEVWESGTVGRELSSASAARKVARAETESGRPDEYVLAAQWK